MSPRLLIPRLDQPLRSSTPFSSTPFQLDPRLAQTQLKSVPFNGALVQLYPRLTKPHLTEPFAQLNPPSAEPLFNLTQT